MSTSRAESINCRSALADRKLVPDDQVKIWCEILQFRYQYGERPDTEEGRTIYYNRIRPLLPKLKFPLSSNPGFAWKLILPKQSEYTHLCDMHKGLNADFVHQWFKFLALEVGARLEVLRGSHRDFVGGYAWDNVVKTLTRLHKIWETRDRVDEAFGNFVDTGLEGVRDLIPVERQSDGCEACILARIASHAPTLFALRAAVKSRISLESSAKHRSRLRLLRLIEPWIELWQARLDRKRYDSSVQQIHENTRLANDLYIKREKIKIYLHEVKHHQVKEDEMKDIFHQAENDIIDSYTALRASQRHSQSIRSQASFRNEGGSSTRLTGERNPYEPTVDPAYRESRYSDDTILNNRRVTEGSSAFAADLYAPNRPRKTDSTDSAQTSWGDVIAGGSRHGNPFTTKASPLGRISEEHTDRDVQSRQGSVHKSVRGGLPELKSSKHRDEYKRHAEKAEYEIPDASSVYSAVSRLSSQDRYDGHSSVSSTNTYDEYYHRQEKQRRPQRESRESEWTNATMESSMDSAVGRTTKNARLSRPFDQPAYYGSGSDLSQHRRYR